MKICNFFKKGSCKSEKDCGFWHPPVCSFFKSGKCTLGSKCVFLHPESRAASPAADPNASSSKHNPKAKKEPKKAKGTVAAAQDEQLNQ